MPVSQKFFWIFFEIPFFNRPKVFYLHLESPSDQENRNGFAVERLWFLGRSVSTREQRGAWVKGHVFAKAKYPAVREATGKLESLLLSQRIHTCLDYFSKAITKIQRFHFKTFLRPSVSTRERRSAWVTGTFSHRLNTRQSERRLES